MKTVVDEKQKFDIGRTINPFKCECVKCDFLNCTNYAPKMKRVDSTIDEFIAENKEALIESKYIIDTDDLLYAFFEAFNFGLGKGLYWGSRTSWNKEITILKFVNGKEATCCHVTLDDSVRRDKDGNAIYEYGAVIEGSAYFVNARSVSIAKRIAKKLLAIKNKKA